MQNQKKTKKMEKISIDKKKQIVNEAKLVVSQRNRLGRYRGSTKSNACIVENRMLDCLFDYVYADIALQ